MVLIGTAPMEKGGMMMIDREKVKYSIERCISHVPDACRDCAYDAGHPYNECVEMMLNDVLALLKEQETKKKNRLPYSPDSNVQWT